MERVYFVKTLQREFAALNWNPSTNKILSNILTNTRVKFFISNITKRRIENRDITEYFGMLELDTRQFFFFLERMKKMMMEKGRWSDASWMGWSFFFFYSYSFVHYIWFYLRDVSLSYIYTGFSDVNVFKPKMWVFFRAYNKYSKYNQIMDEIRCIFLFILW